MDGIIVAPIHYLFPFLSHRRADVTSRFLDIANLKIKEISRRRIANVVYF